MAYRHRHDPEKSLVGFSVGDILYAVSIHKVREIMNPLVLVPMPRAPEAVSGVADYRGEVVPVIDLRVRLGLAQTTPTRRTKWIVVDIAKRHAALVVDAVTEVFGTGGSELMPAPDLGGGEKTRGIESVTKMPDGRMAFVLSVASFASLTEPIELELKDASAKILSSERSTP